MFALFLTKLLEKLCTKSHLTECIDAYDPHMPTSGQLDQLCPHLQVDILMCCMSPSSISMMKGDPLHIMRERCRLE